MDKVDTRVLRCDQCKHFEPYDEQLVDPLGDKKDGVCYAGLWLNGRKIRDTQKVNIRIDGSSCRRFEHKTTGLTRFEIMCKVPEPKRSPEDIEYLSQFIDWRDKDKDISPSLPTQQTR